MDALIGVERLLEEKGTTPEPGGGARIPAGGGRDTPRDACPPLPSFSTPTPVHDGGPGALARVVLSGDVQTAGHPRWRPFFGRPSFRRLLLPAVVAACGMCVLWRPV